MRDSFILHMRHAKMFDKLSFEQCGKLIRAIFDYERGNTEPSFDDPVLDIAFIGISDQLEYDKNAYEKKCKRNSENARKRWGTKSSTTEYGGTSGDTTPCLYENGVEDENETEVEIEIEDGSEVESEDKKEIENVINSHERENVTRSHAPCVKADKAVTINDGGSGAISVKPVSQSVSVSYCNGETGLAQGETGLTHSHSSDVKQKEFLQPLRGRYENVRLTAFDEASLKLEFPDDLDARIERLSEYIATHGDKYYNHAAVIRSWAKNGRDIKSQPRVESEKPTPTVLDEDDNMNNEYFQAALARSRRYLEEIEREEAEKAAKQE